MKILHVAGTFYPATYWGGPIYSVYGLCNGLGMIPGVELRVLTTDSAGPGHNDRLKIDSTLHAYYQNYEVCFSRKTSGEVFSIELLRRLKRMIHWADVVHLTAVYTFTTIPTLLLCRLLDKPLVWSPRGSLQRWEGSSDLLLKSMWDRICNMLVVSDNYLLHVTSEEEALESTLRIPRIKTAIVPNGVDIPKMKGKREWMPGGTLRLIYIGRLDPKKGIENLLKAVRQLQSLDVSLAIYGTGAPEYIARLHEEARCLGLNDKVVFGGHVEGKKKYDAFLNADVAVVPSYTENFAMVVAEALAHGVPVIASKGTPWRLLEERKCGLWVDNAPEVLREAIQRIHTANLEEMSCRGREWMTEDYGWDNVARKMYECYSQLV